MGFNEITVHFSAVTLVEAGWDLSSGWVFHRGGIFISFPPLPPLQS